MPVYFTVYFAKSLFKQKYLHKFNYISSGSTCIDKSCPLLTTRKFIFPGFSRILYISLESCTGLSFAYVTMSPGCNPALQ